MARKTIEKNIAYDTERKLYYVTLNLGKNADGKYEKKYQTAKSKREARQILAAHKREKEKGLVAPLSKDSFVSQIEQMIDLKALQLQETTIYAYRRMLKNHFIPFFKNDPVESITLQKLQEYKLLKWTKKLTSEEAFCQGIFYLIAADLIISEILNILFTRLRSLLANSHFDNLSYLLYYQQWQV